MLVHQGIYLPDGEAHLQGWMDKAGEIVDGRGTYQIKKLRKAVAYCTQFRNAIDVGAHVGFWSMQLMKIFGRVFSFEPMEAHRDCLIRNIPGAGDSAKSNVILYPCALGDHDGMVSMATTATSSGDTWVANAAGDIPLKRFDGLMIDEPIDFVKIDCEGYELNVLKGMEHMIVCDRPIIIVEQKPGKAQKFGLGETQAIGYLKEEFGYQCKDVLSGDYVMAPG